MERISRSLLLVAPRRLAWTESTLSPPKVGEVLVATRAGAVSVGSELPQYLGSVRAAQPAAYPRMTGYESVGVVLACGPEVAGLQPGQRVVGFYGHRTMAVVPASSVLPVPPEVTDRMALLAILSCDVAKGIRALQPWLDEPILVTGAGAIGLIAVWLLHSFGLRTIDIVEPIVARRVLAEWLGARHAYAPDALPAGGRYAIGIECSSRNAAFTLLQDRLRHAGRVCVLSDGNLEPLVLAPAFHAKELHVAGSSDGWDYGAHAAWYFAQAARDRRTLEGIFTEEIAAERLPEAFENMAGGDAPIKIYVRY